MDASGRPDGSNGAFEDDFDGHDLDPGRWIPAHLPQWSSRRQAAARYQLEQGRLVLRIDEDQEPWCPEFDGATRVSSLQTGVFSGPLGSPIGQHRFSDRVVVREFQRATRLYTPLYGTFRARVRAIPDPTCMVAFWMIGFEDVPEHAGEICICEIFGRDVQPDVVRVGMGVHPFGDPRLTDDFARVTLPIDATAFHDYAAHWTPEHVRFFVDDRLVRTVAPSPSYPMQFMLGIYEFRENASLPQGESPVGTYPKKFVIDFVQGSPLER